MPNADLDRLLIVALHCGVVEPVIVFGHFRDVFLLRFFDKLFHRVIQLFLPPSETAILNRGSNLGLHFRMSITDDHPRIQHRLAKRLLAIPVPLIWRSGLERLPGPLPVRHRDPIERSLQLHTGLFLVVVHALQALDALGQVLLRLTKPSFQLFVAKAEF